MPHRFVQPIKVRGLGWEVVATEAGTEHYLMVADTGKEVVLSALRSALPNIGVDLAEDYRPRRSSLAGELATTAPDRQLRTDHPEIVSSALLGALQPLEAGEQMTISLLLFPRGHRRPPQTTGVLGFAAVHESPKQSEPPKEVRDKFARPQFGATIRLGVTTPRPDRDRQLLQRLTAAFHSASSDQAHLRRRAVPNRRVRRAIARRSTPLIGYPCHLNVSELVGLLALPMSGVSQLGLDLSGSRQLAPSSRIPRNGLVVADSSFSGVSRPLVNDDRKRQREMVENDSTAVG